MTNFGGVAQGSATNGDWVALSPVSETRWTEDTAVDTVRVSEFGGLTSTCTLTTGTSPVASLPETTNYTRGHYRAWSYLAYRSIATSIFE